MSDGELAATIMKPGEQRAAEAELCARFAPRVRSYGRRHLRDEDAAQDLVQRVLVLTLEKLRKGEVREPERIGSFILGTARMVSRDMRRRDGREAPLAAEVIDALPAPASTLPEPLATHHLSHCFESLGERERSVILLTFFHDQDADEIAGALSVTKGNVRVIRHRAVRMLRDCMGVGEEVTA